MSSLIALTAPKEAVVLTDTLAVVGGKPFKFTTKVQILPHLNLMIAGTGVGGFLDRWALHINTALNVADIDDLAQIAHLNLARLWATCNKEFPIHQDRTVTVYHFGFSQETGTIRTFISRSEEDFKIEWCEGYGAISRPPIDMGEGQTLPKDGKALMDMQRREQAALPAKERVHIGGTIQVHYLHEGGFRIFTLDKFEDYEKQHRQMP